MHVLGILEEEEKYPRIFSKLQAILSTLILLQKFKVKHVRGVCYTNGWHIWIPHFFYHFSYINYFHLTYRLFYMIFQSFKHFLDFLNLLLIQNLKC
jgi:hypothetical protein